ncbi:uncharacterized protein TNCV_2137061 [Trichonephila clavipes]|nr:uncharacterized protein TNCV_2137061 [Trichonephila clavipes]
MNITDLESLEDEVIKSLQDCKKIESELNLLYYPITADIDTELEKLQLKLIDLNDEAHFWLNGYVNKQNCRIWSEAYPQVYVETPLHPEKLTVWCASWAGGIIGPYFFKIDEGHNVTVNGDWCRTMKCK